eukprot:m.206649 g.206649  ORF g.206649 m.206649 type:complete len:94 (+) comp32959_c0_seq4:1658-1939(+)
MISNALRLRMCSIGTHQLLRAKYSSRLLGVLKSDLGFELEPQTRPCPKCRVVIYRSSGCDDLVCNCGYRFNFTKAKWPTIIELEMEIAQAADQ